MLKNILVMLILLLVTPLVAHAGVFYSSGTPYIENWYNMGPSWSVAVKFIPSQNFSFDSIAISAFSNLANGDLFNVRLMDDSNGVPGGVLESLNLFVPFVPINYDTGSGVGVSTLSHLHPILTAGNTYWIAVSSNSTGGWNTNYDANTGMINYGSAYYSNLQGYWTYCAGCVTPAFTVTGTPTTFVPEPSLMLLLGLGLGGVSLVGWRSKK